MQCASHSYFKRAKSAIDVRAYTHNFRINWRTTGAPYARDEALQGTTKRWLLGRVQLRVDAGPKICEYTYYVHLLSVWDNF
jgi:hypothetical protein